MSKKKTERNVVVQKRSIELVARGNTKEKNVCRAHISIHVVCVRTHQTGMESSKSNRYLSNTEIHLPFTKCSCIPVRMYSTNSE